MSQTLAEALRDGVASGELDEARRPGLAAVALAGAVMYRRMMTPSPLMPSEVEALVATVLGEHPLTSRCRPHRDCGGFPASVRSGCG